VGLQRSAVSRDDRELRYRTERNCSRCRAWPYGYRPCLFHPQNRRGGGMLRSRAVPSHGDRSGARNSVCLSRADPAGDRWSTVGMGCTSLVRYKKSRLGRRHRIGALGYGSRLFGVLCLNQLEYLIACEAAELADPVDIPYEELFDVFGQFLDAVAFFPKVTREKGLCYAVDDVFEKQYRSGLDKCLYLHIPRIFPLIVDRFIG